MTDAKFHRTDSRLEGIIEFFGIFLSTKETRGGGDTHFFDIFNNADIIFQSGCVILSLPLDSVGEDAITHAERLHWWVWC